MGFENDKLGRKDYADILTEMIDNPEKYKRNSDSDSFTMAIDSSWGTGKTEFLKMWEDELKEKKDENKDNKYIVIRYNSWENDFTEEPLQSIIYTILTHKSFETKNNIEKGKEALKNRTNELLKDAFDNLIKVAEIIPVPPIQIIATTLEKGKEIAGEAVVNAIKQETCMDNKIEKFKQYKESIDEIKHILEDITKKTKIILLIDELDRCKPLFAIKLLETIKHIFNVKNMVFVFALDMTQLSYSVEKVYGDKIDASGYICRFFDYITKMPTPDTRKYIEYLIEQKPLIRTEYCFKIRNDFYNQRIKEQNIKFIDMFQECVEAYQLSLRNINTIYANFVILEERELKEIDNGRAYALYLLLLIIKYKNLDLFNQIFIFHNYEMKDENFLYKMRMSTCFNVDSIKEISKNTKIQDILVSTSRGNFNITRVNTDTEQYFYSGEKWEYSDKYDKKTDISPYFFYTDIKNFNNIKEMGIADYIHKKLELFNFEWENEHEKEK